MASATVEVSVESDKRITFVSLTVSACLSLGVIILTGFWFPLSIILNKRNSWKQN